MQDVSPKQGFAAIAILAVGILTGYSTKPADLTPQISFERVDNSNGIITTTKSYPEPSNVFSMEKDIKNMQANKLQDAKNIPNFSTESADITINDYIDKLKGLSAVGVTDADTALKDLGIQ